MLIFFAIFLSLAYFLLINWIRYHWNDEDEIFSAYPINSKDLPFLTVCIVARNEAHNIRQLLSSIKRLNYPIERFEVIIVDDHSEDETWNLLNECSLPNLQLLQLEKSNQYRARYPKLSGLNLALTHARSELIACTDADCILAENWLYNFASEHQRSNARVITGPVSIVEAETALERFQKVELAGIMAVTNAGINSRLFYSANMANMFFHRSDYLAYYRDTAHNHASGDDILFANHMARKQHKIAFLRNKESIVGTKAMSSVSSFISQRIRWASKNKDKGLSIISLIYFLSFIHSGIALVLTMTGVFNSTLLLAIGLSMFISKWACDFYLFKRVESFFSFTYPLSKSIGQSLTHAIYIVSIIPLSLLNRTYHWKGRKLK